MYAPAARPAMQHSSTWDDLPGLRARISRPGTPMTPPLPQVTDPRKSAGVRKGHSVDTTSTIITVHIGETATVFHVHRGTLTQSSMFFQLKCKTEWLKEGNVVEVPDHIPEAFAIYSNWLYTCIIDSTPLVTNNTIEVTQHKAEWLDLAHSYVLGEALIDVDFKDTIMDAIRAKVLGKAGDSIWEVAVELVQTIYEGTSESSCARRFLIDLYHYHAHPRHLEAGKQDLPRDFLYELALAHSADTYKPAVYGFSGVRSAQCSYHCHASAKCYIDGRG